MKALIYIFFSLLIFINAHANNTGKNQTHSNAHPHQNTFLVKTQLTKEQIESLLRQHQQKQNISLIQNGENCQSTLSQEQTQLKVKNETSKNVNKTEKIHKSEKVHKDQNQTKVGVNSSEVKHPEQKANTTKLFSFNIFGGSSNSNESDQYDTEDPPEPDVEKVENETETSENAETAAENSEIENSKVTLLTTQSQNPTKIPTTQSGMSILGFFSVILLTIAFASFLIYATQPKKMNKNSSKFLSGLKIGY